MAQWGRIMGSNPEPLSPMKLVWLDQPVLKTGRLVALEYAVDPGWEFALPKVKVREHNYDCFKKLFSPYWDLKAHKRF